MSEHVEIYKKYRPEKWEELIGQQKTADSLRAAVVKDKLPTAYGFFGPRGCGKTSSAILLAKAVNCPNLTPTGNPCNTCETCENIENNSQIGVSYISMANRGSVDDVRELVQKARLSLPVKKQVWILDEVQNLSRAAFDALLIPIEEKNMPSLFIFCSTEADKIPQTILSRIQSRRFTLVSPDDMEPLIRNIIAEENLTISEELINDCIRQGRGSVRDTLTALETIVSTGETRYSVGGQLLEALAERNIPKTLSIISEGNSEGYDGRDLAEELFAGLRDLLLTVSGVDSSLTGVVPVSDVKKTALGLLGRQGIIIAADEIGEAITRMTIGADPRIHLEIAVIKTVNKLNKLKKIFDAKSQG